jgi:hypothetical protein
LIRAGPLNRASSFCWAKLLFVSHLFRDFWLERDSCFNFCFCECIYIAIVRVPEVCKRAYSQSVTAYRWNDVMIIISKWRFIEGWNEGKFVNLQLKLNIKRSQNNVILLVWIWQRSRVYFWQAFERFHHLIRSANEMIAIFIDKQIID